MKALVRGRVQGVFFRSFVSRRASGLNLVDFVRNLSDGRTVEVIAEGPKPTLNDLLQHLKQGPPAADVEHVDVEWGQPTGEFSSFRAALGTA